MPEQCWWALKNLQGKQDTGKKKRIRDEPSQIHPWKLIPVGRELSFGRAEIPLQWNICDLNQHHFSWEITKQSFQNVLQPSCHIHRISGNIFIFFPTSAPRWALKESHPSELKQIIRRGTIQRHHHLSFWQKKGLGNGIFFLRGHQASPWWISEGMSIKSL